MLGLAIGFLGRHLEDVTTELESFLVSHVAEDIAIARQIAQSPPAALGRSGLDAAAAVATTALVSHGDG
jgi:hypothetical protein